MTIVFWGSFWFLEEWMNAFLNILFFVALNLVFVVELDLVGLSESSDSEESKSLEHF